jgi:hypothetical protein
MSLPPSQPGDWLHRVLSRCIAPDTLAEVVAPTLADLQHEVRLAGPDGRRRTLALVRGYAAVARVVVNIAFGVRPARARVMALLALSVGGATLMTLARWAPGSDSRPFVGAYLLPMFIAPLILARTGLGASYRRAFAWCAAIALATQALDILFYGIRASVTSGTPPVFRLVDLVAFATVLSMLSGVVAVAAWHPAGGRDPLVRRAVLALFFGGVTAAIVMSLRGALDHDAGPLVALARLPFYAGLFAVLLTATAAPLVVVHGAYRLVRTSRAALGFHQLRRWLLATAAALFSPATIVAASYAEHSTAADCLDHFRRAPLEFLSLHLPIVAGASVLGWYLADRVPTRPGTAAG